VVNIDSGTAQTAYW